MDTPIFDFVTEYTASNGVRLHMPGHKGKALLGPELRDITEISGADALYEASGIISASEHNAETLFGTAKTWYSAEGSTQCIKAMLEMARRWWQITKGRNQNMAQRPVIVAARNVHKAFLYAVVALDFDVVFLWPEEENPSLCSCRVTAKTLDNVLSEQKERVAAVYLTSPNYLGGIADIPSLAKVCHNNQTLLLTDNAHGAYLHFLESSLHPIDLGADICCDSAHKTLPVLTGGAYLHLGKNAPWQLREFGKSALELFGSTSPSYLILQSLDLCNRYLADGYEERLKTTCAALASCKEQLKNNGWQVEKTDPLRITIKASPAFTGHELAERLRENRIECEFADEDYLVLMATPDNSFTDLERLVLTLSENERTEQNSTEQKKIPLAVHTTRVMSIRDAYFSPGETIPADEAVGRICRMPMAACPPAIPVVVPGEIIDDEAVLCFKYYGINTVEVIKK